MSDGGDRGFGAGTLTSRSLSGLGRTEQVAAMRRHTGGKDFAEHEHAGWEPRATAYDDHLGRITIEIAGPLLDAAEVVAGSRVLDVACGPGYGAGQAAARGADALGLDFSFAMVKEARRRFPAARFVQGDAQRLDLGDDQFDAVVCMFGIAHFPDADAAIAEAFRVLRPGGRYAFTAWSRPEENDFFRLVTSAVSSHGGNEVALPPAPDMFRFVEAGECERSLSGAGFTNVRLEKVKPAWRAASVTEFIDMLEKSTVRASMLVELQTPEARERIKAAMREGAEEFRIEGGYESYWGAVLVSAVKPG
jgi:ubiquinone/menaquinone biosynthesis C-methylase UbiE